MITRYQRSILVRDLIIPCIMILLTIGVCLYGIVPAVRSIQEMYISIQSIEKTNTLLRKKIKALSAIDEDTLNNQVNILLSAVPGEKAVTTILSTIENVASENNITLTDLSIISPGSISSASVSATVATTKIGSNTISITTNILGSIADMESFLTKIRSVRRLLRISKVNMNFIGSESSMSAKTKLDLEAFYAPLPRTIGKASEEIKPLSANEEELLIKLNAYPLSSGMATKVTEGVVVPGNRIDPFSP